MKAEECLVAVSDASSKDATLLYACVLEAQTNGDKGQAAAAMKRVLEKYKYGAPSGVYLPALLRYDFLTFYSEVNVDYC